MPNGGTDIWGGSLPMSVTVAFAVLMIISRIADLQKFATMLPACFVRWKENVSLFNSVNINRSKNRFARVMILPFIIICARFDLYRPAAVWAERMFGTDPFFKTLIVGGVFAAYLLLRELCVLCFRGKTTENSKIQCARNCVYTFFISAVILMLAAAGICSLFAVNQYITRKVLLWILAFTYTICLLRKTQIFAHYRGFLAGISYLCTLEFLPTGLLIVSSLIF